MIEYIKVIESLIVIISIHLRKEREDFGHRYKLLFFRILLCYSLLEILALPVITRIQQIIVSNTVEQETPSLRVTNPMRGSVDEGVSF